ncbi:hypothetical protein FOXG_22197 [Fusarium oxysporum f. sp. lycopersici 4287]|uniref:Uncharacterized protein n=1 Tax=Fusarium oxysporum f. sp. lycopersici (strain 4287 / CBS 123668 / FGSC 9935 / NRRL 34936) TaxID=426428 RepID=A0A0J9WUT5_FUSO4|nr:hypothetical protein FOXG_22062 [Fusarium oxysporum f. sp. lycopersici 4287]XP_018256387.1 uncharacterized protein FOXG_22197 [Fusarium oxysporum f. sp. lycopersici 4287]KNB17828.1 hypothetical protein FOXG_22062 [Fusarium oxysporum f. sp. lycopersici 4287]KNB18342.1 hypothetical protein FOXG_22197 [Fusarium oxysporum f. sp. lycopersici 4287]
MASHSTREGVHYATNIEDFCLLSVPFARSGPLTCPRRQGEQ